MTPEEIIKNITKEQLLSLEKILCKGDKKMLDEKIKDLEESLNNFKELYEMKGRTSKQKSYAKKRIKEIQLQLEIFRNL